MSIYWVVKVEEISTRIKRIGIAMSGFIIGNTVEWGT